MKHLFLLVYQRKPQVNLLYKVQMKTKQQLNTLAFKVAKNNLI